MIRNGFIRSIGGDWFSMVGLDRVIVNLTTNHYGDMENEWHIEAVWIIDEEEYPVVIERDFESMEEAQSRLDEIMS